MSSTYSSDPFGDFDSSGSNNTLDLPAFGHIFQTDADLVEYAQGQAIEAGYALIIARSTCDDSSKKN